MSVGMLIYMRFVLFFLTLFCLVGAPLKALCCEHSGVSAAAVMTAVEKNDKTIKSHPAEHKHKIQFSSGYTPLCCSGVGMVCCLAVPNSLIIINSNHHVSEELYFQDSNYKSYVAYTLQRPPCNRTV